jgi:anti-anti-sigma factor
LAQVRDDSVQVTGDIDLSNAGALRGALQEVARRRGCGFVVDLTRVGYMDSTALRVLYEFADFGPRVLVRAGSMTQRLLTIAGFDALGLVELEG